MKKKSGYLHFIKILLAIAPILFILYKIDVKKMLTLFGAIHWPWFVLIVFNFITGMFLFQALRAWILLKAYIEDVSFQKFFIVHCKSLYYSIILPSASSKDIVRAVLLSKDNDFKYVWGATWISKLSIFTMQLCIPVAAFSFLWLSDSTLYIPQWSVYSFYIAVFVIFILSVLSFSKKSTRLMGKCAQKILPEKINSYLRGIREGVYLYKFKKKAVLKSLAFTFLHQALLLLNTSVIIRAATGSYYLLEILTFRPLIELVSVIIPITPNGTGVRELLCTFFFNGYLNISLEKTGIYVMVIFLSNILRLLGGIPLLIEAINKKDVD